MAIAQALITPTEVEAYRVHGWARLPQVFTGPTLDALRAACVEVVAGKDGIAWEGPWQAQFPNGAQFTLKTQHGIHTTPAWSAAMTRPDLLESIARLLGVARVTINQSTVIIKPPQTGQAFPPHQDSAYYGPSITQALLALVHLDDTVPENGPLRYLSGSHRDGARRHESGTGKKHLPQVSLDDMTEVCASAGDVLVSDLHTVHGSYPNVSDRARRLVRVVYVPA